MHISTPANGTMFFVDEPEDTIDTPVNGTADVGSGTAVQNTSLVYVIDASGSTTRPTGGDFCGNQNPIDTTPGWFDSNMNGTLDTPYNSTSNELIDCEILAVKTLNQQAIDLGTVLEVSIVGFGQNATIADTIPNATDGMFIAPNANVNSSNMTDLDEVVMSIKTWQGGPFEGFEDVAFNEFSIRPWFGSSTNYGEAIEKTQQLIPLAQENSNVIVVFLSDGFANFGPSVNATLVPELGATYYTFAVGPETLVSCDSTSTKGSLQEIADKTGGTCTQVENPEDLPTILPEIIMSSLDTLSINIDNGTSSLIPNMEIDPDLPQNGPISVNYNTTAFGLGVGTHDICVMANGTDQGGMGSVEECTTIQVKVSPADLSLTKTVDDSTPNVNDNITYILNVTNSGPNSATDVTVKDLLPSGVSYVSSTPSQGSYNNSTGIWDIGTISNGGFATLNITASVDSLSVGDNTAQVQTSNRPDPDSTPGNDEESEDDQQTISVTPQEPPPEPGMLQINKTAVGGDGEFSFLSDVAGLNNFNITTTDGTGSSAKVNVTGIFNVTEIVPEGWTLNATATSCDDGSPTDAINVTAGEFVTCTFVNDIIPPPPEPGMLQINKTAVGGDDTFSFESNVPLLGDFEIITSSGTGSSAKVNVTGIFNVTEIVPEGWTLISNTCDDGSPTDAINVTAGEFVTCTFQNEKLTPPEPTEGFMTGGGFVNTPSAVISDNSLTDDKKNNSKAQRDDMVRISHGFELHCNPEYLPNNLEVNWLGNSFHMTELLSASCLDDSTPNEPPKSPYPGPTLDVYVGEGSGRFNGEDDAHVEWIFTDNGEPGKKDEIIKLIITTSSGDVVLSITDTIDLNGGNHQFLPHNTHHHEKKLETATETSIKNNSGKSGKDNSNVDKAKFFSEVSPTSNPRPDSSSIIDVQDSKGGGNEHLTRPTFGLSHETQESLIDGGFTFNDQIFLITDNHHTPFQEQSVIIGEENTFSATLYADKGLKVQEFLFGIPNIGEAHLAELGIEVWYGYNNEINEVKAVQKSNVIDKESIIATHEKTKCTSSDLEANCDTTNLSVIFLEPLKDKVMAIKAIDFKNRYQITYLNEGLDISGSSLNPMKTKMIPSDVKGEGLIQVTQIEKYSPYWISEDGRLFEMNSFGSFNQINKSFERFHDSGDARTRLHSGFGGIIAYEQNRATEIFDSDDLTKNLQKSFSYSFPEHDQRINNLLENQMLEEESIAEKILEQFNIKSRW